ncbi:MAG TPA: amidohydrolase family protein, partial [Bacteroidales bacterium]|nr:amidohydrolase family protein [Bacteroidales bacterium]
TVVKSREEALRSMTVWAARSCFAEQFTGSLEAGKVADFIILDGDIITAEEKIIPSIKVAETWSGGKRVY